MLYCQLIFTLLIISASFTSNLFAQKSISNINYLKATNNLWSACYSFNSVMSSNDQNTERLTALPLLKSNINSAKKCYAELKLKYPNDTDLKQLELWIKAIETSYNILNSKDWQNDPTWQMGFTLIQLDIRDFVNNKLK